MTERVTDLNCTLGSWNRTIDMTCIFRRTTKPPPRILLRSLTPGCKYAMPTCITRVTYAHARVHSIPNKVLVKVIYFIKIYSLAE